MKAVVDAAGLLLGIANAPTALLEDLDDPRRRLARLMSDAVELAEVPQLFERWLAGRTARGPVAARARRVYCAWLATTPDRAGWQGDPLIDPLARDQAARDFRRWLHVERRAAASTVNLALASLDALYRCLGSGRPHVRRDKPVLAAPRALDEAAQRRLLRAADNAPVLDRSCPRRAR